MKILIIIIPIIIIIIPIQRATEVISPSIFLLRENYFFAATVLPVL